MAIRRMALGTVAVTCALLASFAPAATAKKHTSATTVATKYVRDALFEDPYLNADEAGADPWYKFNFCHSEYEMRDGHGEINTTLGGNWHIGHARVKNGKLRTATVAYVITDYLSLDAHDNPGDPEPPTPGSYALVAHGPTSATIDGLNYTRYGRGASCGVGGPGGF